jgi:hypothetical protein
MSKYTPLENHLKNISASQNDITLTFAKIEEIIADKLPRSAQTYREWWSNEISGTHVQANSWLNAGWQVEAVDQSKGWVRWVRKQ